MIALAAAAPSASTPGSSLIPETTDLFTAGHLVLIAVLAALAIAALVYGARLRGRRKEAEREVKAHNAEVRDERPAPSPASANLSGDLTASRPAGVTQPPPVAPAPPPASDADLAGPEPLRDEPIAAQDLGAATLAENPAAVAAPPAPAGGSPADGPVTQLKGLGPKVAAKLAEQGITTVGQLAGLSDDEAAALDARLGPFAGRMGRDRWLEQARFLAAGDRAGFEAVFGRL